LYVYVNKSQNYCERNNRKTYKTCNITL